MYVINVFGKGHYPDGTPKCPKCEVLKGRLAKLLPDYEDMSMVFHDVTELEGLVAMMKAGVVNPNRIPAFLVSKDGEWVEYQPEDRYSQCNTGNILGIQTDYDYGRGVITPNAIKEKLDYAVGKESLGVLCVVRQGQTIKEHEMHTIKELEGAVPGGAIRP